MRKIGYNHGSEEIAGCYIFGIDSKSLVTQSTEALLNGSISKKWLRASMYRHNSLVIGFSLCHYDTWIFTVVYIFYKFIVDRSHNIRRSRNFISSKGES